MRILAVYGSQYGQAERVVKRIAGVLEGRGHAVRVRRANEVPSLVTVEDFDAVVVGASIIMGHYQAYVRDFVVRNAAGLRDRPTAFVSVSGSSPEDVPAWRTAAHAYVEKFLEETGWIPRWTAEFSGALRYRAYGLVTRLVMKGIAARYGGPTDTSKDYEFTDWNAVDRFAAELADGLALGPAAAA